MAALTPKQQAFVLEFLVDLNASQVAKPAALRLNTVTAMR